MSRIHISLVTAVLFALAAVFAAAHSTSATYAPPEDLCFTSGSSTYRIATDAVAPDFRIRIGRDMAAADLRIQLVDRAELADFVLVDDNRKAGAACRSAAATRTVAIDDGAGTPDVTVSLTADWRGANYRIFVHSVRYSQQDAAAILAAMWKAEQRRATLAQSGLPTVR